MVLKSLPAALLLALAAGGAVTAKPIAVRVSPIVLAPETPELKSIGRLQYRGGLDIRSADARLGGLSGMTVSANGRKLVAVSDRGHWLTARIQYDTAGNLTGLHGVRMMPLRRIDGRPLKLARNRDAESIARLADGSLVVGFERFHRIRHYRHPGADADRYGAPQGLAAAPVNGSIEALTRLADGKLFLIAEKMETAPGIAAAWIGGDRGWRKAGYRRTAIFRPVGAATGPGGDVFVLERRFTTIGGIGTRLVRVPEKTVRPGTVIAGQELARLAPPMTADNFEAIAVRRDSRGETLIYTLSDDNFNPLQRTLLLLFALAD